MRSYHGQNRRAVARSRDGGITWSRAELDPALVEPVYQASLINAVPSGKKSDGRLLFSNPANTKRAGMAVRPSYDDGKTWPVARLIHEGPSAYSSLAVLRDHSVALLYERGIKNPYEAILLARFALDWLTAQSRQTV
jgi:sialidase-1